jgi:hypothetical protein
MTNVTNMGVRGILVVTENGEHVLERLTGGVEDSGQVTGSLEMVPRGGDVSHDDPPDPGFPEDGTLASHQGPRRSRLWMRLLLWTKVWRSTRIFDGLGCI